MLIALAFIALAVVASTSTQSSAARALAQQKPPLVENWRRLEKKETVGVPNESATKGKMVSFGNKKLTVEPATRAVVQ